MPLVNRTFDQLIDFTRTSAATFVNSSGNIASTPQSRNLLTFTQEFDNAAWTKSGASAYPFNPATATLGPELISNGDFSGGTTTGWTPSSATISVVGGQAELVSTVNGTFQVNQQIAVTAGRYYMFSATIRRGTCPQPVYIGFNGGAAISTNSTTDVVVTGIIAATTTPQNVQIYTTGASIGQTLYFDNVSVREIVGGLVTAPDGTSTADTLVATTTSAQLYQTVTLADSTTYAASVYLKKGSGSDWAYIRFRNKANNNFYLWANLATGVVGSTSGSPTAFSFSAAGNGWYRLTVVGSASTGGTTPYIYISSATADTAGSPAVNDQLFIWGAQLEQASAATDYTRNFGGLFPPRFDYDPVTRAPRGLLIEEQRTNLLLRSEEFDNASWTKTRSSITANATTSPDGTVDADKLVEDTTASDSHFAQQVATVVNATTYTWTVYAKAAERTWLCLYNSNVAQGKFFNLSNGTLGSDFVGAPGSAAITNAGNGWYRCSITFTTTGTTATLIHYLGSADGVAAYTGDGASGVFLWGAQLEAGAFATSYIPTVASQVTRSADVAAINAPNFASWFNAAEGTLVSQFSSFATVPPTRAVAELNDGTANNRYLQGVTPGFNSRFLTFNGGVAVVTTLDFSAPAIGSVAKWAIAYRAGDYGASLNGAAALTSTYGSVLSGINSLRLGSIGSGSDFLNGHLRSIRYYPTRLTNAQLQALTA